ncbi:hypothetical protein [Moorena sp. SIO4G3]|uniref:hypothetical protein n=1 Tax=Moorena sp. SIO4G3 TaxID=2607821 RepID=UPI00142A34EA|nr:hypothetical protein [Moorena sp. SIO4G3]NEO79115.1 hypothetical protein [Moorena sp. SIO4G3]
MKRFEQVITNLVLGSRESGVGSVGGVGRWGDGEMGRWGVWEVWGDGEMGRWGDGELNQQLV